MDRIPNLMEAARAGNIDGLYEAIKNHPNVLKEIDEIQFVNTPLHEAASAGQTDFALEMMNLAPSLGRKLNPDGLSPLDLALLNKHYDTVKRLVRFDGELVRVKGKERLTPLHRAAESDDKIGCLVAFLLVCPASIEGLTIRDETALHIAMKKSSAEAFKILYEWVTRAGDTKQLLQKKDAEDNSAEAYHMKQQPKDGKSFHVKAEQPSSLAKVDDDTKNLYDYLRTPELCYESTVRKCLQFMLWTQRNFTMETRNAVLVVAVLIATASFQAIITPEGGQGGGLASHNNTSSSQHSDNSFLYPLFKETSHNCTKPEVGEDIFSQWFYFLNTIAFTASVGMIIMALQLRSYTFILHLSLIFMIGCYWSALNRILCPLGPFVTFTYYIGTAVYISFVYYLKILFWTMEGRKPEFLAILLFSCCLKEKYSRRLIQMSKCTLK